MSLIQQPRRKFLKTLAIGVAGLAMGAATAPFAPKAFAAKKDWRQVLLDRDRYLSLERQSTGEKAVFRYYRYGAGFERNGYNTACWLLRDVKSNATYQMNPKLIDLLYLIQSWLRGQDHPYHIIITSGYRTPQYNASIKGAARNSEHTKGNAADIRIPGVSTETLRRLAREIGVGGVGFYPRNGFVHVDVGRIRTWNG